MIAALYFCALFSIVAMIYRATQKKMLPLTYLVSKEANFIYFNISKTSEILFEQKKL